jgi:hypothetical protein
MFFCKHCNAEFSKRNSMYRHAKHSCKVVKEVRDSGVAYDIASKIIKENKQKLDNNQCYHCDKSFSSQGSVYRHMQNNCNSVKKEKECKQQIYNELKQLREANEQMKQLRDANDELKQLREENEQMKHLREENEKINKKLEYIEKKIKAEQNTKATMINNGTVVNGNMNNTVNVTISFGKEDMSKIDDKDIVKSVKSGFHSALELTDAIHFNPKYPEYHNVYIPSMKDKYGMVYKEGIWELIDKQELIDKMYNDKKYYIEDNADTFYDSMSKSQKNALRRWLLIDNDDDEKIKSIKDRMKLLLYNKRSIPIDTKNTKRLAIK